MKMFNDKIEIYLYESDVKIVMVVVLVVWAMPQ